MNFRYLGQYRGRIRPGDIFVAQYLDMGYLFGRVISTTARWCSSAPPDAILLYIYRGVMNTPHALPLMTTHDLLIPPLITDFSGWRKGVFKTVAHEPLSSQNVLPQHCFEDLRGDYWNENGDPLPRRLEPCAPLGLDTYYSIDQAVSRALGIPFDHNTEPVPAGPITEASADDAAEEDQDEWTIALILPVGETPLSIAELEDALDDAVQEAGVGEHEGHGFDLQTGACDIRFTTSAPEALLDLLQRKLRMVDLPPGAHLLQESPSGERKKVDVVGTD